MGADHDQIDGVLLGVFAKPVRRVAPQVEQLGGVLQLASGFCVVSA